MKYKGFWIAWIAFILSFIADMIVTFRGYSILSYIEVNPLAFIIHSPLAIMIGIILLNITIIIFIFAVFNKCNPTTQFIIINTMVIISIMRFLLVIPNNIAVYDDTINMTIAQVQQYATPAIRATSLYMNSLDVYLPFITGWVSFILWRMNNEKTKRRTT